MSCDRCGGLLVVEPLLDFYDSGRLWKCINCGGCSRGLRPGPTRDGQRGRSAGSPPETARRSRGRYAP